MPLAKTLNLIKGIPDFKPKLKTIFNLMNKVILAFSGILILFLAFSYPSESVIKEHMRGVVNQTRAYVAKKTQGLLNIYVVADPNAPFIELASVDKWFKEAVYIDSFGVFSIASERWKGKKNLLAIGIFGKVIFYSFDVSGEAEGVISGEYM